MAKNSKFSAFAKAPAGKENPKFQMMVDKTQKNYKKALEEFKFNDALVAIWGLISFCDRYIEKEKPWEGDKGKVINDLLFSIGKITVLLQPFLPETAEKIQKQLKTKRSKPLFPRI